MTIQSIITKYNRQLYSTSIFDPAAKGASVVLQNNNLSAYTSINSSWKSVKSNTSKSSGKYVVEFSQNVMTDAIYGIGDNSSPLESYPGSTGIGGGWHVSTNASNGTGITWSGPYPVSAATSFYMMAIDLDNKKIWYAKDGVWVQGDPSSGTNPSLTWATSSPLFVAVGLYANNFEVTCNFGLTKFVGNVPTGFIAGW